MLSDGSKRGWKQGRQIMSEDFRVSLALLWRRILRTDPAELFESEIERLQNRSWGDQLPQPGYVGPEYSRGGLAFVSMNPGGGRGVGLGAEDLKQYKVLQQLRDDPESAAPRHFDDLTAVLQEIMPTWTITQRFVLSILQQTGIPFSSISYFNLLKWRTSESNNLRKMYDISWKDHTAEQVTLLAPSVVIAIGVDAGKAFRSRHSDVAHFDVIPRVIGNNIGEPGREAIRRICNWLSTNARRLELSTVGGRPLQTSG
jgi:hypothetical protein